MDRKAIEQGFLFEKYVAKILDLKLQSGSGNKFFARNDAVGHGLSVSAKSQFEFYWSDIKKYLNISIDDSQGTGNIPILAVEDKESKDQLVVMRLTDFAKSLNGGTTTIPEYHESKGIKKRNEADIAVMLRLLD